MEPKYKECYHGFTTDEWVDRFIDYWESERESYDQQPDYDDVDAWAPFTEVTSIVWWEIQEMRKI